MRTRRAFLVVVSLLWFAGICTDAGAQDAKPDRQVAITIDDLPAASGSMPVATITAMTTKLLTTLRDQKIPVVGFVNERGLYRLGEVDQRIAALRMWLDYGFDLGNHTYTHASLSRVGLKAWEDDVIQGESVTTLLLAEHKMKMRYFRHPYLDTGNDLPTRRAADSFLAARGYRVAPVTVDPRDWSYSGAYEEAKLRGDQAAQDELAKSYLAFADAAIGSSEQHSKQVLGYEPKQVVLLHANQLEADHIGELMEVFRKRGYRFVTLEDALSDPAYSLPDTYAGGSTGWIEHWAVSQGKTLQGYPEFPQAVIDKWTAGKK